MATQTSKWVTVATYKYRYPEKSDDTAPRHLATYQVNLKTGAWRCKSYNDSSYFSLSDSDIKKLIKNDLVLLGRKVAVQMVGVE